MTERTRFLRKETLSGRNKIARAVMPVLDVSETPGGIPVRKARGFRAICENMPLYIGPRELIVGTRTWYGALNGQRADPQCTWHPLIAYPKYVTEEDVQRFGGDYRWCNSQHYTPDFGILLHKGIGGILLEAKTRKLDKSLRTDQQEFLDSVIICYTGLQTLILRYGDYAAELSRKADSMEEQQRLREISQVCAHISSEVPKTYREALQLLWFGHLGVHLESGMFINYGRLDVVLGDFLGDTPREIALELTECLLLKMYDQADVNEESYLINHEGQLVVTLGGVMADGSNAVNDVTMLFLDAISFTRLPEPEFNLRLSSCNPPVFLDKAAELTVNGCNFVSYYNDDTIVPALITGGQYSKPESKATLLFGFL